MTTRTATKKENPDTFLVEYTNRLMIQHLLLAEDHLLEYSREPSSQCLACLHWHLEKLIAYSSLECVKFEGTDVKACQSLSQWASQTQDKLDKLSQSEALELAKKAREYRYKLVETEPAAKVKEPITAEDVKKLKTRLTKSEKRFLEEQLAYKEKQLRWHDLYPERRGRPATPYIPKTEELPKLKAEVGCAREALEKGDWRFYQHCGEVARTGLFKEFVEWLYAEQAKLSSNPVALRVTGTCEPDVCSFKVKATDTTEGATASVKQLRKLIKEVSERAAAKVTPMPVVATDKTWAMGITKLTRYEFQLRLVDAKDLVVSHDAYTFDPNPEYLQVLQPRLRDRASNRLQVENIAAHLEPDLLLLDYRSIDKGTPIVGPDNIIECGNGRVMAIIRASRDVPENWEKYRRRLRELAPEFALSPEAVDKMKMPILVRLRLTPVDRRAFAEECNARTTIESSAIENARTDAAKITLPMLISLDVLENEVIADALKAIRNKPFTSSFLNKLPEYEQAALVDAQGVLNQPGVRRIAMAVFVATFKGDVGLRLAEKFFESTDANVLNTFNGMSRSLGLLAQAESLTARGERQPEYAIGEDLAKAVEVFSAIKKTPGMTTAKYIAQLQLYERELSPFQERVLVVLDEHSRSAKRIGAIFSTYAQMVLDSVPPQQVAMIETARLTKEQLFEEAVRKATAEVVTAEDIARLFAPRRVTKAEWERALKYQLPLVPAELPKEVAIAPPCPPVCLPAPPAKPIPKIKPKYELFDFQREGVAWLKGRSFALLADQMGLGKTPQAIHWGADLRPVLVVVPASLTFNWRREISEMWRPEDTVIILDGKLELPHKPPDWTILSYSMLNHYLPELKRAGFKAIIIDEAHLVKNLDTQRTKNVLELVSPAASSDLEELRERLKYLTQTQKEREEAGKKGDAFYTAMGKEIARIKPEIAGLERELKATKLIPNRLAVTGTPIVNRPIELFPLLVFLGVKSRGNFREFLERYTEHRYVKRRMVFTGTRNVYELHQSLKPFMLRRMKKDVLKQLPPKVNTPMFVPISNAAEYIEAERNFLSWLRDKAGDEAALRAASAEIIVKMNALRMLTAIGKVQPVCDWLKPCRDGQGKVLVFCSFVEPLNSLQRCKARESVLYTGALSPQERQALVDHFQHTANVCYFLGTMGAAGVGITLTAANRVCFLDLPWTPGAKVQAEDRAHRIGQVQSVEIVNILAKGTIDERMLEILRDKELIIAQAIDGRTRDEAASASIANTLIASYVRAPMLAEPPCQYEAEIAEPEPQVVSDEDLQILQGFSDVTVEDIARLFASVAPEVKELWQMTRKEYLLAQGGKLWEKGAMRRIYFDGGVIAKAGGLRVTTYKTGNISGAWLDSNEISNTRALKILDDLRYSKFWFDFNDNKFHSQKSSSWHETPQAMWDSFIQSRRLLVEKALAEGKPVPDEVLKDYPDLAKAIPKAAKVIPDVPSAEERFRLASEFISRLPVKPVKWGIGGSTARGIFRADSDIDVHVLFEHDKDIPLYTEEELGVIDFHSFAKDWDVYKTNPKLLEKWDEGLVTSVEAIPKAEAGIPYEFLAKKMTPCNLPDEELQRALSWKPLRDIIATAVGAGAKAQLCSVGMVAGIYELSLNNLTIDADSKILNLVMKTTRIRQVHTPVATQRIFEVRLPIETEPSELTWKPQEVIERRGERGEQVRMFEYQPNIPKGFIIEAVGSIVPKRYEAFKVGVNLERSKQWDIAKAPKIKDPKDIQQFFELARRADREWLLVLCFDYQLRLVGIFEQSIGTQTETLVSGMELARIALLTSATSLILAHNHPSGDPFPSESDRVTFRRVKDALSLIQVEVPDFFVIGHKEDYSMASSKTLPAPEEKRTALFEPKPRWCYGVETAAKELGKLTNRLARAKTKVSDLEKTLETPVQICRGQVEMFGGAEMAEDTTIKVSGKCATDDIESCIFTIRRVGVAIRAKGYKELADALEETLDKLAKRKAKVKEEAEMEAEIGYKEFYPIWVYATLPWQHWTKAHYDKLVKEVNEIMNKYKVVTMEAEYKYAKGYLPKEISVYPNTIEKHYIAEGQCQAKTFRVVKPEPGVLVYLCCAKGDEMKVGRCHPNPTVHKTIVPKTEKYEKELEHLRRVHPEIPVTYHKEEGVEAREPLTQSEPVVGEEHSVSIPLITCPGSQPVSPELQKALKESEIA